ncbi:MAG: ABC transporter ATP-binding protein, partial [Ktedonobacteraceae bacterium]|nr:ABC transporter ATP-binding protein [Ktedonobacteraceae bacterium]
MSEARGGRNVSGQQPGGAGFRPGGPGGGRGMGPGGGWAVGMPVEKAKDFKGTLWRMIGYLKPHMVALVAVLVASVISTIFNIVSPKILGQATTKLFEGVIAKFKGVPGAAIDFNGILQILMFLVVLYVISSLFNYIQQYIMAGVAQKTVYDLREQVEAKLSRLPLKFFDSRTHGEIMSRAVNDMDNISTTLQQSLTQLIMSSVTLIGTIVMMLTISWQLTLIVFVTLPLSLIVTTVVAKRSQNYFKQQQRALGELNGHVEEMYTGHKIVKAFGFEERSINEFSEINERLYQSGWKAQFVSGAIMPLMMFIGNIGYVFVSVVGGIFVTRGTITIGDVQAFIQYARQFTMPITQLANIANIIQSTIASAERIFELLDEEEEVLEAVDAKVIQSPNGAVQFEHVKFGYKEDVPLMEDMNIDVKPGQTIAIVGPTGAGKTTLVNLLMRFYEVNGGAITVDGVDITHLKRGDLRGMFGMVLQDTWLFNGTIRDNIAYGREGATEEEIVRAARAAHADHFIRTLPEGYDTILNQDAT